jgi:hypothetical protein
LRDINKGSQKGKIFKTKTENMIERGRKLYNERIRNFTPHENYLGSKI